MRPYPFIVVVFSLLLAVQNVSAKGFADGSDMSTPDMAKCSAAALKIDKELWGQWYSTLKARYELIYKDKSPEQIQAYTFERVLDKRRGLNRLGFDSKRAFKNYFNKNCSGEI